MKYCIISKDNAVENYLITYKIYNLCLGKKQFIKVLSILRFPNFKNTYM